MLCCNSIVTDSNNNNGGLSIFRYFRYLSRIWKICDIHSQKISTWRTLKLHRMITFKHTVKTIRQSNFDHIHWTNSDDIDTHAWFLQCLLIFKTYRSGNVVNFRLEFRTISVARNNPKRSGTAVLLWSWVKLRKLSIDACDEPEFDLQTHISKKDIHWKPIDPRNPALGHAHIIWF